VFVKYLQQGGCRERMKESMRGGEGKKKRVRDMEIEWWGRE
jgi:hypothetical protein